MNLLDFVVCVLIRKNFLGVNLLFFSVQFVVFLKRKECILVTSPGLKKKVKFSRGFVFVEFWIILLIFYTNGLMTK